MGGYFHEGPHLFFLFCLDVVPRYDGLYKLTDGDFTHRRSEPEQKIRYTIYPRAFSLGYWAAKTTFLVFAPIFTLQVTIKSP